MQFQNQKLSLIPQLTKPIIEGQQHDTDFEEKCNPVIPKLQTFDRRIVEDIKVPSTIRHMRASKDDNKYTSKQPYYPHKFDFNSYEFYENEVSQWKNNEYKKQFQMANANEINKKKIFQQMVQLVYVQATKQMQEIQLPALFQENQMNFCKLLVKSPKLQQFFTQFNESFQKIMYDELSNNQENFKLYIKHPREPSKSYYPNIKVQNDGEYIKKTMDDAHEKFNYKKQKQAKMKLQAYGKPKNEKNSKIVTDRSYGILDNKFERKNRSLEPVAKKKEKIYSNFQIQLKESALAIDHLISSIDINSEQFNNEVDDTQYFLEDLDREMITKKYPMVPGIKINSLMAQWGKDLDKLQSPDELHKYSTELWVSLKQYEEEMKSEIKGHEYIMRKTKSHYLSKIKSIQVNASFQISALEMALQEIKLKQQLDRERYEMELGEMQSKAINQYTTVGQLDKIVVQCDEKLILRNVQEARVIIKQLVEIIKGNSQTLTKLEDLVKNSNGSIQQKIDYLSETKKELAETNDLRLFYQKLVMKLTRDLQLLKDQDEESNQKFMTINENEGGLLQQKYYRDILENDIDINQMLVDHANKVFGFKYGLDQIKTQAGILIYQHDQHNPSARNPSNSSISRQPSRMQVSEGLLPNRKLSKTNSSIVKSQFINLIDKAIEGYLETPVATMKTGQAPKIEITQEEIEKNASKRKSDVSKIAGKNNKRTPIILKTVPVSKRQSHSKNSQGKQTPSQSTRQSHLLLPENKFTKIIEEKKEKKKKTLESQKSQESHQLSVSSDSRVSSKTKKNEKNDTGQSSLGQNQININISKMSEKSDLKNIRESKEKKIKKIEVQEPSESDLSPRKPKIEIYEEKLSSEKKQQKSNIKSHDSNKLTADPAVQSKTQRNLAIPGLKRHDSEKSIDSSPIKASKVQKSKKKPGKPTVLKTVPDFVQEPVTEPKQLTGLCLIDQEMEHLQSVKYVNLKEQILEQMEIDPIQFKLNALQIQAMQEFIQTNMGEKLPYNEYSTMFTGDIQALVTAYTAIVETHYGFKGIKDYLKIDIQSLEQPKTIKFGDILKPQINEIGEFVGLQIRNELIKPLYMESDFELTHVKRVIKICAFVNRMVQNGKEDDFQLIQIKGGEKVKMKEKEFTSIEIQVDEEELKRNMASPSSQSDLNNPDSDHDGDINWQVKTLLKNHAIDIMTRLNPTKKGYYKLVWEDMTLEKLYEYKLENIFKNREKEQKNQIDPGMPYGQYLQILFATLQTKLHEMGLDENQMTRFVLDEFINTGVGQVQKQITDIDSDNCKSVQAVRRVTDNYCLTGPELMPKPIAIEEKKDPSLGKNHLILDKALEQEFKKTFELFDSYVDYQTKNERLRKNTYQYSRGSDLSVNQEANKYFIQIGDIKVNNQSMNDQDIDLKQDLGKVRGRIANAIDDMKQESDVMLFSHTQNYNRSEFNQSVPQEQTQVTQLNSTSHSQTSYLKNQDVFIRQNMTSQDSRKFGNNLKGNILKAVKKAEKSSGLNGSQVEINSTNYTGSQERGADRLFLKPGIEINVRQSFEPKKKSKLVSIKRNNLNRSTNLNLPKIIEDKNRFNQTGKLFYELQNQTIDQSINQYIEQQTSSVLGVPLNRTNSSIPSQIMGKIKKADVQRHQKRSALGTLSATIPSQIEHYKSITNQPHSFMTVGQPYINKMDFQSQQFIFGGKNKDYIIAEENSSHRDAEKSPSNKTHSFFQFNTTMNTLNNSPMVHALNKNQSKIIYTPNTINFNKK